MTPSNDFFEKRGKSVGPQRPPRVRGNHRHKRDHEIDPRQLARAVASTLAEEPRSPRPTSLEPVYESGGDKLKADLEERGLLGGEHKLGPQWKHEIPLLGGRYGGSDKQVARPSREPVILSSPLEQPTEWEELDELAEVVAALQREGKTPRLPTWDELIYRHLKRNPESPLLQSDDFLWWVWSQINAIRQQRKLKGRRLAILMEGAIRRLTPPTRQERQAQIIEAARVYDIVGSYRKTEELTGIPKSTIHDWRNREP